jgi:hypothetical protein
MSAQPVSRFLGLGPGIPLAGAFSRPAWRSGSCGRRSRVDQRIEAARKHLFMRVFPGREGIVDTR